jgi:hypothetical protein
MSFKRSTTSISEELKALESPTLSDSGRSLATSPTSLAPIKDPAGATSKP